MSSMASMLGELPVITEPAEAYLNPRQLADYKAAREACFSWLLTYGKAPNEADGYAFETVKARGYRMDLFYRWVWQHEGGYTANVPPTTPTRGWLTSQSRTRATPTSRTARRPSRCY